MLQFDVYDMGGKKVDSLSVDEAAFGGTVNRAVLREAVLMYQANRRSGTGSAKNRVDVRGTRKKPFRQKGTGRARQGSWLAPHHRGGGVAHGPQPRDFGYSIPKKARLAALKSAYLDKLQSATHIVDQIELESPKTRSIADMLAALEVSGSCLIATLGSTDSVVKSVRNLPNVTIKRVRDVNALDLLKPRQLVVTRAALESVVERFNSEDNADGKA